jgi:glycosyltransferase involved in cell wall biosynthesis
MHDGGPVSGISTYVYRLFKNLILHNQNVTLYQYFIFEPEINPPVGTVVLNKPKPMPHSNIKRKILIALNLTLGSNWHHFKKIESDLTILSNPSLLDLTKYIKNCGVIAHDLYYLYKNSDPKFLNFYYKGKYKLFDNAKFIISNSNFTKMDLISKLNIDPKKITTVYPYIDKSLFFPGDSNFKYNYKLNNKIKIILSVASEQPNKNIETVIKLMTKLPENYILVRVGKNNSTLKLIKDLNLEKRVILKENITETELADIYRGSDMLVFPSLFEGFGIPVIEAMATGTPVIVSNRGSLPEIVGNSGIISDPFDIDFMAEKIQNILEDDRETKKYKELSLKRAELFTMENQYNQMMKILNFLDF